MVEIEKDLQQSKPSFFKCLFVCLLFLEISVNVNDVFSFSYLEPTPVWSVKREASFGHGELTLLNSTTASWQWHRNQDDESVVADEVFVNCLATPRTNLQA